jgi:hypothetical protein
LDASDAFNAGELDGAIRAYEEAIALAPSDKRLQLGLQRAQVKQRIQRRQVRQGPGCVPGVLAWQAAAAEQASAFKVPAQLTAQLTAHLIAHLTAEELSAPRLPRTAS